MDLKLNHNNWVLVTGGSRGIGASIVKKLLENNTPVVFFYHSNSEKAQQLIDYANQINVFCSAHQVDITNTDDVKNTIRQLVNELGGPWGVVNNAGIIKDELFYRASYESWSSVIRTNVDSLYNVINPLISEMMMNGGSIVNISSVTAFRGNIGQTNYASSKAAIHGFTKSLALELARFKVRVNVVAPGLIETDMLSDMSKNAHQALSKMIPLKRIGTGEDVANMVEFLLSGKSDYITGQIFVVDGGLT